MTNQSKGCHEWIFEFTKKPNDLQEFAIIFDNALKTLNSDYEAKRHNDITLKAPIIHSAKPNLFYEWMASRGKLGGQNKVPRLSNDREYIDPLLLLNKA